MPLKITLTLSDEDLKHFRNEIKKAKDSADDLGLETIISSARGMVQSMSESDQPTFVKDRVEKLDALIEMVTDEKWDLPQEIRNNVVSALAYFVQPQDIIPDDVPALGFLDDAIMIELIVRELKHDIEAYQDFVDFGRTDKERPSSQEEVIDSQVFKEAREKLKRRARRRTRSDRTKRRGRGLF